MKVNAHLDQTAAVPRREETEPTGVQAGYRHLSVTDYRDKMKAGWVGQIAGVSWGAPTEFKYRDTIMPEDAMPAWQPGMINDAFDQDDLYVEMTFLRTMEQHGLDCSIRQAGIDFANSGYRLWCANDAGRKNLRNGIAPPDSSHPKFNNYPNDIDYQIEADFSGLIAPGMPNVAISSRLCTIISRNVVRRCKSISSQATTMISRPLPTRWPSQATSWPSRIAMPVRTTAESARTGCA